MSDALTSEQLAQIAAVVRTAVREEIAEAGLRIDGPDHVDEAREDFRFMRKLRKAIEGAAGKVGMAIILLLLGALFWLVTQGMNVWKGL